MEGTGNLSVKSIGLPHHQSLLNHTTSAQLKSKAYSEPKGILSKLKSFFNFQSKCCGRESRVVSKLTSPAKYASLSNVEDEIADGFQQTSNFKSLEESSEYFTDFGCKKFSNIVASHSKEALVDEVVKTNQITDSGLVSSVKNIPSSQFNGRGGDKSKEKSLEKSVEPLSLEAEHLGTENIEKKVLKIDQQLVQGVEVSMDEDVQCATGLQSEEPGCFKLKNNHRPRSKSDPNFLKSVDADNATGLKKFRKLTSGFSVATNQINKALITCKNNLLSNQDEVYTCKQTYKKQSVTVGQINKFEEPGDLAKTKKCNIATSSRLSKEASHQSDIDHAERIINENLHNANAEVMPEIEANVTNPILDYNFIAIDHFFTAFEHLHGHLDLVRNGIQQLIDNFTHPRPIRLQEQENILLEFKQSIKMLLDNIEVLNYSVYNLPHRVANMRYLLLPCKNTILELNNYAQGLAVELEHTQYFNNDSPMVTLLKMVVVINMIYNVTARGRRAFTRTIERNFVDIPQDCKAFDLIDEYERYIRPTFDLLFRRTDAMVQLRNLSGVLYQLWDQSGNWNTFLPNLQLFIRTIRAVEPYFSVPKDWYVVRILPETRLMHVFDGFISEFYRAIVTPGFANDNPEAFGAIFTVLKYILDNIINQHVVILRDLLKLLRDKGYDLPVPPNGEYQRNPQTPVIYGALNNIVDTSGTANIDDDAVPNANDCNNGNFHIMNNGYVNYQNHGDLCDAGNKNTANNQPINGDKDHLKYELNGGFYSALNNDNTNYVYNGNCYNVAHADIVNTEDNGLGYNENIETSREVNSERAYNFANVNVEYCNMSYIN